MKRIIFCLQSMVMGGVEKELITILQRCDKERFDITVLVLYETDKVIHKLLPSWVKYVNLNIDTKYYVGTPRPLITERLKRGKIIDACSLLYKKLVYNTISPIDISALKSADEQYDLAICFHIHSSLMINFVAEKISAKEKIAWVHNDLKSTHFPIRLYIKYFANYDRIVSVSHRVNNEVEEFLPEYRDKCITAYNVVDIKNIINMSMADDPDPYFTDQSFKLLTVGRFDKQKGIDIAIEACKLLRNVYNLKLKWYVIGWGDEEKKYRQMINAYNLEDMFVILGRKDNPYPYIKCCDVYLQPSRHEAWGLVITEAKVLCRPIICTNFAGADEQIVDGVNGRIVHSFDACDIAEQINDLYHDERLRNLFTTNLSHGIDTENETNWSIIEDILYNG